MGRSWVGFERGGSTGGYKLTEHFDRDLSKFRRPLMHLDINRLLLAFRYRLNVNRTKTLPYINYLPTSIEIDAVHFCCNEFIKVKM